MKGEEFFLEPVTVRIWQQYFQRLDHALRPLDEEQRRELGLEVRDHLMQGFREIAGASEAERLLTAIDRLGEPDEFIRPLLADKLLKKASRTLTPTAVVSGLYYYLYGGAKRALLGSLFGVGYLISLGLVVMAALKIFFPAHIGLLVFENGDWSFGIKLHSVGLKADVLGFWIIPLGLAIGTLLYWTLTKLLRVLKQPKTN
jgi:uncharacterized membrane protein